ncbi:MAG: LysR family transcriptional regulator [Alphaproteobacteria bacterium]|nr:MAG: LysR family transcriptional regulator [Alphaproteobacteria bacterium]
MTKWDDYEVFCNVAEHGGFTAAARYMNAPKSSLSAAIRRLEAELNVRLLERSTRAVRLTEAGTFLYGEVRQLFSRLREARDETMSFTRTVSGVLRIAAPYEFAAHHLGPTACRLMTEHPALNIQIDMRYAPISLFEENYDIVFSMVDHDLPSSNTVARRVLSLRRAVFAAPALVEAHGLPTTPAELARMPLIATSSETDWTFQDEHNNAVAIPVTAPRMRSANADIRLQAAIQGLGVTRITATYCQPAVESGKLLTLLPGYLCEPLKIYAMFPSKELMPHKVRMFLDALDFHHRADAAVMPSAYALTAAG